MCCNNWNFPVFSKIQKVTIPTNDANYVSSYCRFEELVISRIGMDCMD